MSTSKFEFIDCLIVMAAQHLCYKAAINFVLQYFVIRHKMRAINL